MATRSYQELLNQRAALITKGGQILDKAKAENRAPTAEENTELDAIDTQCSDLTAEIGRVEKHRARERLLVNASPAAADREGAEALKRMAANFPRPFATFGEQLQAIARAAITGEPDPRLVEISNYRKQYLAATGASEKVPSDGGYLVQQDTQTEMLTGMIAGGELLRRVRRIPMSGGSNGLKINTLAETSRADGSRWGGIRAYWTDEAGSTTATKPAFRQIVLDLKKLTGLYYATEELLADAAALEAIARAGFQEEMTFKTEDAIFRGDGSGKPLGVLNAPVMISVSKETGQVADTFVAENAMAMFSRLRARNLANSIWTINQALFPQLMRMYIPVGTGGLPVYLPPGGLSSAPYGLLFGRPVVPLEYNSAPGDLGDVVLGDFGEYTMIDKGAPDWASSMHVAFTTGETVFRMTYRVDGQPTLNSPLTPYKNGGTIGPFVTLAAR